MSPRSFGRVFAGVVTVVLLALGVSACERKIPGNPRKVMEEYIKAVQGRDFETIYRLNRVTARQKKYLEASRAGDVRKALETNYQEHKADFESAPVTFTPGVEWAEKHFFPPGSEVSVGEPYYIKPVGDDPVNAKYEEALTVMVKVLTKYLNETYAPELNGRKIKSATFDCSLGKIRLGKSVRVYSHDDEWYFNGCLINLDSVQYF